MQPVLDLLNDEVVDAEVILQVEVGVGVDCRWVVVLSKKRVGIIDSPVCRIVVIDSSVLCTEEYAYVSVFTIAFVPIETKERMDRTGCS